QSWVAGGCDCERPGVRHGRPQGSRDLPDDEYGSERDADLGRERHPRRITLHNSRTGSRHDDHAAIRRPVGGPEPARRDALWWQPAEDAARALLARATT